MRTPCQKRWHGKREDVFGELFDDKVIDGTEISGGKTKLRKEHIKTIHAKCEFIFQFSEIGLFEAGAIANDEGAFAFVNILERGKTVYAFTPPRMQIRSRQLRQPTNGVRCVAGKVPERGRENGFDGLFHVI